MRALTEQLAALPAALKARLEQRGFDAAQLVRWAGETGRSDLRNRLQGSVRALPSDAIRRLADPATDAYRHYYDLGAEALAAGQVAICVLAGGMATRMGGVVKALVKVAGDHTFLDMRLAERHQLAEQFGAAPPLWLMTSEPTDGPTRAALAAALGPPTRETPGGATAFGEVATFEQFVSLRLGDDRQLFVDDDGAYSVYATGHGDLPDALRRSGLLDRFIAGGGRWLLMCNLDNLGARIDAAVLGEHIDAGRALTVELAAKWRGDKGGGPVMHDGKPIICEDFRLPLDFDAGAIATFNTNTFWVDALALRDLALDWTYVEVQKQVGSRHAVQFERLLGEITVALDTTFLEVPRSGPEGRFLPTKSYEDLDALRPQMMARARRYGLSC